MKSIFLFVALLGYCLTGNAQVVTAGPAAGLRHAPNPHPDWKLRGLGHLRATLDDIDPAREVRVTITQPAHFQYHVKLAVTMADGTVSEKVSDFHLKGVIKVEVEFYGKGNNGKGRGKLSFAKTELGRLLREMNVRDIRCTDAGGTTATVTTEIR